MKKKFYETPFIDFKLFESQEDLLSYTSTESYPGDIWGEGEGEPEEDTEE